MDSFDANSNWIQHPTLLPSEFFPEQPPELLFSLTECLPSVREHAGLEALHPISFSSAENASGAEPLLVYAKQTPNQQEGGAFQRICERWTCGSLSGVSETLNDQLPHWNISFHAQREISSVDDTRENSNMSHFIEQYRIQSDKERIKRELEAALGTTSSLSEHRSNPETSFVSSKSNSAVSPRRSPIGDTKGGIRQKKPKSKRARAPARPWTEEEHQRFKASLEIYGRNWEKCAKYIGTRRAQLVRSHAQKYLIKLWKLGKPLPKKVAESGKGYTLSGKPLLAESASARSYLTRIAGPDVPIDQSE